MAIVRISLTDHRYFVHFITAESSEYNLDPSLLERYENYSLRDGSILSLGGGA